MDILGIDIGGSGIKGAPVDVATGKLNSDRIKVTTPKPALPEAVIAAVKEVVAGFSWTGRVGLTFSWLGDGGADPYGSQSPFGLGRTG